jgi:hypothetical protein
VSVTPSLAAAEWPANVVRTRAAIAATWLGAVAQFAFPQVTFSLAPLRGYAITRTLSRIGTANGCRGQDPTAPPDWLSAPLQLGMVDGRDYVTGTAVGAPLVVVLAACVGLFAGVVFYLLGVARSRLWLQLHRMVSGWRGRRTQKKSNVSTCSVESCAVAAASGGATLMTAAAAIVSQSAAAAAVLRVAEGAVEDTPGWYPAAAVVGAAASVLLPVAALHVAWVGGGAMYVRWTRPMRLRSAEAFRTGGLKHSFALGALGEWQASAAKPLSATRSILRVMWDEAGETLYRDYCGGGYAKLAVAHFVVTSQALQGMAQAAGEFVSGARASCIAAASTQLLLMAGVTAVLQWARPHRVHRNYYAELLPTAMQAGLCVLVVLLAARRSTSDFNRAQVEIAVEIAAMLQPAISVALVFSDAFL